MKPKLGDKAAADKETLTCQLVAVLTRHNHHPVPLDGDGRGRAGQVGDVGDADHQDVAGGLKTSGTKKGTSTPQIKGAEV